MGGMRVCEERVGSKEWGVGGGGGMKRGLGMKPSPNYDGQKSNSLDFNYIFD